MFTIKTESPIRENRSAESTASIQLVGFRLAGEEYGVEITKVQEIILMGEVTRVPQTPAYVKGLINLRNMVIPILDLRLFFGLSEAKPTEDTRIVVVSLHGKTIGVIVDAVTEVLRVGKDQVAAPPPTVIGLGREYLVGLVKLDDRLLIVLDMDYLLTKDETANMGSLDAQA
ncbi:MAG TPA: chemotaxis protein CheW [Planctomycetaceae bacterium]|nr:chemotaxis protein CheW [Planctomycetaceae bacterium]